jgi:hypothetical protein
MTRNLIHFLLIIIFGLFLSCSQHKQSFPLKKSVVNEMDIAESAVKESWTLDKFKSYIGEPSEVTQFKGNFNTSHIYEDRRTGFQSWSLSIDSKNSVVGLAYFPTSRGKTMFMDELRKRWANLKCFEKIEPVKEIPHVIRNQRYLSCEDGKIKAYYSQYEEVQFISISK